MRWPKAERIVFQSLARPGAGASPTTANRNRGAHIIMGLLFGRLGFHNFYAGCHSDAASQFVVTCIVVGASSVPGIGLTISGIGTLIMLIWVLNDLFTVTEDANGFPMA